MNAMITMCESPAVPAYHRCCRCYQEHFGLPGWCPYYDGAAGAEGACDPEVQRMMERAEAVEVLSILRQQERCEWLRRVAARMENAAYAVGTIAAMSYLAWEMRDFVLGCARLWFGGY